MIISGKGLNILIDAPFSIFGDWSAFALCYSIKKYLPESVIYLDKKKSSEAKHQYFRWMPKLEVRHFPPSADISLSSSCVIIRPIDSSNDLKNILSEAKQDKFTPFVSYKEGCGKFVMANWINSNEYLFPYADSLMSMDACVNEIQVLKLWKQMNILYTLLVGG
jgi:hypothetical protein